MFAGHLGIAIGAKGVRRDAPLWLLVLAAQACDWVDAAACAAGATVPPAMWSHSLPAAAALAVLFAAIALAVGAGPGAAGAAALVTLSHVVADYLTGSKPTWPGGPMIGLNLYDRPLVDFAVEVLVVWLGWRLYVRSLPDGGRGAGRPWAWALLAALVAMQAFGAVKFILAPTLTKCLA